MVSKFFSRGLLALQLFASLTASEESPRYKDSTAPVDDRVADLLGRMTIEDKMAQLIQGVFVFVLLLAVGIGLLEDSTHKNRRYHQLDEFHIRRIQLYRSGGKHEDESWGVLRCVLYPWRDWKPDVP